MALIRRRTWPGAARLVSLLIAVVVGLGVAWPAGGALAHTDFESSVPADGEAVDAAVDEITLTFTNEAVPIDGGVVVLTAAGVEREASAIVRSGDRVVVAQFDPPLDGGVVGVRWTVTGADGHPLSGTFVFTTPVPASNSAGASPTTSLSPSPGSDGAAQPNAAAPAAQPESDQVGGVAPPSTTLPDGDALAAASNNAAAADASATDASAGGAGVAGDPTERPAALDDFLADDTSLPGEGAALVGRLISGVGLVFGLGVLVFAAAVLGGRGRDALLLMRIGTAGAASLVVGAALDAIGTVRLTGDGVGALFSSGNGRAALLRLIAGAVIVATTVGVTDARQWMSSTAARVATGAGAVAIASYWFDGHTAALGPRPVHAVSNSLHLLAGIVWGGGVLAMAVVAWSRWRRNGRADAGSAGRSAGSLPVLVVRFSKLATLSLVGVVLSGVVMTALIIDSPGDLTGTEWGKVLLLKTAAAAIAMAIGAYNHVVLRPRLDRDPALLAQLRSLVTSEAIILGFVVMVVAWLVAAAV